MKSSEFVYKCAGPAKRKLSGPEQNALIRMAKTHTGSLVLKNWKIYLWGGGHKALEFEELYPVPNDFRVDTGDPFAKIKRIFKAGAAT